MMTVNAKPDLPDEEEEDCVAPEEETEGRETRPEEEGSVPEDKKPYGRWIGTSSLQRSQEYADVDSAHFPPIQPSSEMPAGEMETGMLPGQPPQQYAELCLTDRHSIPENYMFVVEYAKVGRS